MADIVAVGIHVHVEDAELHRDVVEMAADHAAGEAEGLRAGEELALHALEEDVLELPPPLLEGLLGGHDLDGVLLVHPAVLYMPAVEVELLHEVHRHAGGCHVLDGVTGLLQVPEKLLRDEGGREHVRAHVQTDEEAAYRPVEDVGGVDAEDPSDDWRYEEGPVR